MNKPTFEWDENKEIANIQKHGIDFYAAQFAFLDPNRLIAEDIQHSAKEKRYYCFGKNETGDGILTVRFTMREYTIRIIGAGYWRKGRKLYEQANSIH